MGWRPRPTSSPRPRRSPRSRPSSDVAPNGPTRRRTPVCCTWPTGPGRPSSRSTRRSEARGSSGRWPAASMATDHSSVSGPTIPKPPSGPKPRSTAPSPATSTGSARSSRPVRITLWGSATAASSRSRSPIAYARPERTSRSSPSCRSRRSNSRRSSRRPRGRRYRRSVIRLRYRGLVDRWRRAGPRPALRAAVDRVTRDRGRLRLPAPGAPGERRRGDRRCARPVLRPRRRDRCLPAPGRTRARSSSSSAATPRPASCTTRTSTSPAFPPNESGSPSSLATTTRCWPRPRSTVLARILTAGPSGGGRV